MLDLLDKRIESVTETLGWCRYYKSEWAVTYWESVLNALYRKRKRMTLMEGIILKNLENNGKTSMVRELNLI